MTVEIIEVDGVFIRQGKEAYREGVNARENNKPKDNNPYEQGSYAALQWGKGWCRTNYSIQLEAEDGK